MYEKSVYKPLIIGLPGAGKSTVARCVAERMGLTVLNTDSKFRQFRRMPITSMDSGVEVMRNFLERAKCLYPMQYPFLERDAATVDNEGRCALHDGIHFRSYGESVFRLFEVEMLQWLHFHGEFSGTIPDLSASALLHSENRALFNEKNGYQTILLDTPQDQICQNIIHDYDIYMQRCEDTGRKEPIRGKYESHFGEALRQAGHPTESVERQKVLLNVAATLTRLASETCMPVYRLCASNSVVPKWSDSPEKLANEVIRLVSMPAEKRW